MIANTEYFFAYGTLLQKGSNEFADFLHMNSIFKGKGYLRGKVFDLGEYPGAVETKNPDEKVWGKVFELQEPEKVIPVLDEYEGAAQIQLTGSEYIRKKVEVFMAEGEKLLCWAYLYEGHRGSENKVYQ